MSLAGLILAGGESRRMGSPKALLDYGGETFLDRLILILGQSCSPVIVVLGHEPHRIKAGLQYADLVSFVTNPDYSRGQLSSLQCGLAAVPQHAEGVMFTPVDHAAVRPSTVALLARRFHDRSPKELLVIPRYEGKRGHPVCASGELFAELLALPDGAQAREVIHRHLDQTTYLDVDDPGVTTDIDDPAAYRRILES